VVITDQLDKTKLDFTTFSLGPIAFGDKTVVPPFGLSEFNTDVNLRPASNLIVRINAKLNTETGLLTWRFVSLDPATMQPTDDPLAGFLPPNRNPPEGDGEVFFTVMPKSGLTTGSEIRNRARVVFDVNEPIDTPEWLNTIDNSRPVSQVLPLAATQNSSSFEVRWSGTDSGSGVQTYTIFVSENGGPFTAFLNNTTATSATFHGQPNTTYAFYSVARDETGNREDAPTTADAVTATPADVTPPLIAASLSSASNAAGWHNVDVTVTWSIADPESGIASSSGCDTATLTTDTAGTTLTCLATNSVGLTASESVTVKIDKTAPAISCGFADGLWHPNDVVIACTATDGVSGLANAVDASFSLSTSVASGTETANALTNSHTATDLADNSAKAGPIGGNRVDKKAPDILITSPTKSNYPLNQEVAASYNCAEGGSGIGPSGCVGTVASGSPLETSAVGLKVFTVQATDLVGNSSALSVNYAVTYQVRALYDETKAHRNGSTIPVKLQLTVANGVNMSSQNIVVTALGISQLSTAAPEEVEDAGNANPDDNFRFTNFDGGGGYIYNLKTTGLTTGTYVLIFSVAGDPITHSTQFKIR